MHIMRAMWLGTKNRPRPGALQATVHCVRCVQWSGRMRSCSRRLPGCLRNWTHLRFRHGKLGKTHHDQQLSACMPVSLNINNRPTLWLSRLPERTQAIKLADLKINNGFQWRRGRSIYIWGALLPSPCGLLIIREACHSTIGNHSHARILICAWEWLPMYCHLCPIEFCTGFMVHSSYLSHLFPHYDSHP